VNKALKCYVSFDLNDRGCTSTLRVNDLF